MDLIVGDPWCSPSVPLRVRVCPWVSVDNLPGCEACWEVRTTCEAAGFSLHQTPSPSWVHSFHLPMLRSPLYLCALSWVSAGLLPRSEAHGKHCGTLCAPLDGCLCQTESLSLRPETKYLTQRWRLADWIRKQNLSLSPPDRYHQRVKGWKKVFQEDRPKRQAIVAILISDKIISNQK